MLTVILSYVDNGLVAPNQWMAREQDGRVTFCLGYDRSDVVDEIRAKLRAAGYGADEITVLEDRTRRGPGAIFWAQANRFAEIANQALANQLQYSFNRDGYSLWRDIERAARRCRVERIDRARAMETV